MIFIDANIFLEVMLQQKNAEECKKLLQYVEKSPKCAWINIFHVFSMVLIVQHKTNQNSKSKKLIESLGSYEGLQIYVPTLKTILRSIDIQLELNLDFDDSLVIATMTDLEISNLVTFDKHFDEIKGIEVLNPLKALNILEGERI